MNNLFNKPPFSHLKKGIETMLGNPKASETGKLESLKKTLDDFVDAPWKIALIAMISIGSLSESHAASPQVPDATSQQSMELKTVWANKMDSLSCEIKDHQAQIFERAAKAHARETKISKDENGKQFTTKSYWMKGIEDVSGASVVDITYADSSGVEIPVALSIAKASHRQGSKAEVRVTDGAYGTGIRGMANHVKITDSQGVPVSLYGFKDQLSKDGQNVLEPVGDFASMATGKVTEAFIKTNVLYETLLKGALHIKSDNEHGTTQHPAPFTDRAVGGRLSQNVD